MVVDGHRGLMGTHHRPLGQDRARPDPDRPQQHRRVGDHRCGDVRTRMIEAQRAPPMVQTLAGAWRPSCCTATWIIWLVNPHSLSYQLITLTRLPPTTRVRSSWTMEARGSLTMSAETSGSSATARIPWYRSLVASCRSTSLTSSAVVSRPTTKTTSAMDPTTTGPRTETPSKRPSMAGSALAVAVAAPVLEGTKLWAAARPRRRSLAPPGLSTRAWVAV